VAVIDSGKEIVLC